MITKESFCAIIRALQNSNDVYENLNNDLNDIFKKYNKLNCYELSSILELFYDSELEYKIISILKSEMSDENEWISYFIYDLDYGRKYEDGCVIDDDGMTFIKLSTPEELYDFLLTNMKNKEKLSIETILKILGHYPHKEEE